MELFMSEKEVKKPAKKVEKSEPSARLRVLKLMRERNLALELSAREGLLAKSGQKMTEKEVKAFKDSYPLYKEEIAKLEK